MIENVRKWVLGAFVGILFMLSVIGALGRCTPFVAARSAKVDTILTIHTDSIVVIKEVLKDRIKVIHDLAPDPTDSLFDSLVPNDTVYLPSDTVTKTITVYQEKRCIEAIDSLQAYKQIVKLDSSTIDTLQKIAKEKEPFDWKTLGIVGSVGLVLGILLTR